MEPRQYELTSAFASQPPQGTGDADGVRAAMAAELAQRSLPFDQLVQSLEGGNSFTEPSQDAGLLASGDRSMPSSQSEDPPWPTLRCIKSMSPGSWEASSPQVPALAGSTIMKSKSALLLRDTDHEREETRCSRKRSPRVSFSPASPEAWLYPTDFCKSSSSPKSTPTRRSCMVKSSSELSLDQQTSDTAQQCQRTASHTQPHALNNYHSGPVPARMPPTSPWLSSSNWVDPNALPMDLSNSPSLRRHRMRKSCSELSLQQMSATDRKVLLRTQRSQRLKCLLDEIARQAHREQQSDGSVSFGSGLPSCTS